MSSDYPPSAWIPVAAPVTFRREGLTFWSQVDRSVALGGGELTVYVFLDLSSSDQQWTDQLRVE